MVPYIAALILLIVAVLFAVYARVDGFALSPLTVSETTKVETLVDYLDKYIELNKSLIKKLKEGVEFDEDLTPAKATELGLGFTPTPGSPIAVGIAKPLSGTLLKVIQNDTTLLESMNTQVQKRLASGEIRKTMTVKEALKNQPFDGTVVNQMIAKQRDLVNAREAYILSKLTPPTPPPSSGSATDASGVSLADLFGGLRKAIKASTLDEMGPVGGDKGAAPPPSTLSTDQMEKRIANNVATQLKDSLLAKRSTEPVVDAMPCPYAAYTSTSQGQEYMQARPNPGPDMSEYIRKDSIPCWNCSLP